MNPTDIKRVKIIPKQPRFISDILKFPTRIDSEIELDLNIKEIIRCMQFADVFEGDVLLTPENFNTDNSAIDSENDKTRDGVWNELDELLDENEQKGDSSTEETPSV